MVPNRIMRGGAVRGALLGLVAALALALTLSSCGGSASSSTTEEEKQGDAAILNEILGRQMAAVDAYGPRGLPDLHGPALTTAGRFGAQEQEHIDSIVKALRGLGAKAEPRTEEIETGDFQTQADYLRFFYEVESETIDRELSAISNLAESWPRTLLGTIVANQAEHLVLLRQGLGATPREAVPEAFEDGTAPAP